jgi:hypothetical protein
MKAGNAKTCKRCRKVVVPGTPVALKQGHGMVHQACAA